MTGGLAGTFGVPGFLLARPAEPGRPHGPKRHRPREVHVARRALLPGASAVPGCRTLRGPRSPVPALIGAGDRTRGVRVTAGVTRAFLDAMLRGAAVTPMGAELRAAGRLHVWR